ncbi:MAG TPA: glycosyltransferase [bacterium]|nr:glycosyltransferase [bacterium]
MTICYFGDYHPNYPRHKILINGLRLNGVEVIEKRTEKRGLAKYVDLIKMILAINYDKNIALVLVAYSDSRFVWLLKIFAKKPLIWNAFYSIYDNWIYDRKLASPLSLKALYFWLSDWICCQAADLIILETNNDIEYFVKTFHIKKKKFIRVFVGYDEEVMYPRPSEKKGDEFIVEFHGKYIPVQGIEYIVKAAKLLENENIKFIIIGEGQEYNRIMQLKEELKPNNINFMRTLPFIDLPPYMAAADVCLGLLGDRSRIDQAIPNKIYEAAGMKKACINADTKAIHELFTNRENILLCHRADPKDLAAKILELKNNPALKERIAQQAHALVREKVSFAALGKTLKDELEKHFGSYVHP